MAGETTVILHDHLGNVVTFLPADNISGNAVPVINVANQATRGIRQVGDDLTNDRPVLIGGYACTSRSNPTPQVDNKMQMLKLTADGLVMTQPYGNAEDFVTGTASDAAGASTQVLAAVSGKKLYVTWVHLVNTHASTGCYVELKDGSTVKDTIYVKASDSKEVEYLTPLKGTVTTAWNFDPSAAVATIICTMGAYTTKV